jgi:lysophospholipase
MLTKKDMVSLPDDMFHHYQNTFIENKFHGVGSVQLRYVQQRKLTSATDALILLGGRTEFAEKYAELFFDLRQLNIAIYSYDHRGQGLSERILADYNKGYVDHFDDYSEDLKIFIDQVVSRGKHQRLFVLCHSMGGAVTAQFQLKYPGIFHGLIFSAPMFGINTSPASPVLTEYIAAMMVNLGCGKRYIFKGKASAWKIKFKGNPLTSNRQRFQRNIRFLENNPLLELGSPTFNWLKESMAAGREILAKCAAGALEGIPMVVLQGERDRVVTAAAQNQFSRNIPTCALHVISGAKHELLMEDDDKRNQALTVILDFLKQHGSSV